MRYLLLAMFLVGCGRGGEELDLEHYDWDVELKSTISEFIEEMEAPVEAISNLRTVKLRHPADPSNRGNLGICTIGNGRLEVFIDSQLNGADRQFIAMHELGHCLLDLDHDQQSQIMYPNFIRGQITDFNQASVDRWYRDLKSSRARQGK